MSEVWDPVVLSEGCCDVALYVWAHVSREIVPCFLHKHLFVLLLVVKKLAVGTTEKLLIG